MACCASCLLLALCFILSWMNEWKFLNGAYQFPHKMMSVSSFLILFTFTFVLRLPLSVYALSSFKCLAGVMKTEKNWQCFVRCSLRPLRLSLVAKYGEIVPLTFFSFDDDQILRWLVSVRTVKKAMKPINRLVYHSWNVNRYAQQLCVWPKRELYHG